MNIYSKSNIFICPNLYLWRFNHVKIFSSKNNSQELEVEFKVHCGVFDQLRAKKLGCKQ